MKPDLNDLLLYAAANGAVDECLDLLRRGADPRAKDHEDGSSALHWAADGNHREVCRILIEAGADIDERSDEGDTPLHHSALTKDSVVYHPDSDSSHLERPLTCRFLVEAGADLDARNDYGETPLHLAAQIGSAENCRVLVEAGGDPNARNEYDETPLHRAVSRRNTENCRVLIEAGADARAKDNFGLEPIYHAFWINTYGYIDIFRCFVEHDPSIVRMEGKNGDTLLLFASTAGDPEVVRFLVEAGSDPNARNRLGNSPLHEAAAGRRHGTSPEDRLKSCELLLAAGADPTVRNDEGRLPEDETDDDAIRDLLRAAREARELGTAARPVEELQPSRRRRLGRRPAVEDETSENARGMPTND